MVQLKIIRIILSWTKYWIFLGIFWFDNLKCSCQVWMIWDFYQNKLVDEYYYYKNILFDLHLSYHIPGHNQWSMTSEWECGVSCFHFIKQMIAINKKLKWTMNLAGYGLYLLEIFVLFPGEMVYQGFYWQVPFLYES